MVECHYTTKKQLKLSSRISQQRKQLRTAIRSTNRDAELFVLISTGNPVLRRSDPIFYAGHTISSSSTAHQALCVLVGHLPGHRRSQGTDQIINEGINFAAVIIKFIHNARLGAVEVAVVRDPN